MDDERAGLELLMQVGRIFPFSAYSFLLPNFE